MQYSLRNILISFAVAGTGAAVFCAGFKERPPVILAAILGALFSATLLGLIWGRNKRFVVRVYCWLTPPLIAVIALVYGGRWYRDRVIYSNECAISYSVLRSFQEAETNYYRTDWDNDGVQEFASTLKELCDKKLIDREFADAEWPSTKPFHGYYFKVLTKQKFPEKRNYRDVEKKMTKGYAIIAWPAQYFWTGYDRFQTSHSGTQYISSTVLPDEYYDCDIEFNPDDRDGWFTDCSA